ncbi:type II secretion system F family protein [Ornithinimicrobium tianjinense]|uniref:Type II secretion system protein n=1 Tax=Ornithinimicrobium tianjinense TaxID=1195761 RepID=A0A917F8V4_9MICO|nr:type II secretion system F family protein [Ornithinimicrobium tianjinense]GGF54070.1 type II secretion system protein [Ornithinimicrobium tianjinense]
MSAMLWPMLSGAVAGLGLYLFVRVLMRPRPGVASLVARIDAGSRSMQTRTVSDYDSSFSDMSERGRGLMVALADRMEVMAAQRGWELHRQRADLAILNRSVGAMLATKIVGGLILMLTAPLVWGALRIGGLDIDPTVPLAVALLLGLLGFFLPDLSLRSEAEVRRREFRRTVGIFLDLVSMNLAGGRGLPEALLAASSVSDHWSVVRIRQTLANARLFGTTPWEALGRLGKEIGLEELESLAGTLILAADDGAKIRQSLSSRATTMRRKQLSEAEGDEGERSQSMLVAQMLLVVAFLVYLAYPALMALMGEQAMGPGS